VKLRCDEYRSHALFSRLELYTEELKEFIEEKLGIDLEDSVKTTEGLRALKQLELDREEFLLTNALENRKLDLADIQGAREMNTRVNESANASFLAKNITSILALFVVIGGGILLAFTSQPDVRTAAVGLITLVLGFYFGTTSGSQRKDATIANLSGANK
jgi:hypothetical protein